MVFVRDEQREAPRYATFSNLLLLAPSLAQMFAPSPCSGIPAIRQECLSVNAIIGEVSVSECYNW
jgi:hypothetical protein